MRWILQILDKMIDCYYMKLFFILGREAEISKAEIESAFNEQIEEKSIKYENTLYSPDVCIFDIQPEISPQYLMNILGGTIKIGVINTSFDISARDDELLEQAKNIIMQNIDVEKKMRFGFSIYDGTKNRLDQKEFKKTKKRIQDLGIPLKKILKGNGLKVRYVTSHEPTLSSVTVTENKLIDGGKELVFILDETKIYLGTTEAVQAWKEFSARDYGRPGRDAESGMMPPKLSRILINLAQAPKNAILADPFCGSGTIISEALLLGYRKLIASDIDSIAIANTKENVRWLVNNKKIDENSIANIKYFDIAVTHLGDYIEENSVDTIVTETYLGPPQKEFKNQGELEHEAEHLLSLYQDTLRTFEQILKPGGRVVIAFPLWRSKERTFVHTPIISEIESYGFKKLREPLTYGRDDQKVWREIVIFEKK